MLRTAELSQAIGYVVRSFCRMRPLGYSQRIRLTLYCQHDEMPPSWAFSQLALRATSRGFCGLIECYGRVLHYSDALKVGYGAVPEMIRIAATSLVTSQR
jgi:hypothetical protein